MKKKLTLILDILVFLCLLFMGADTLSIELGSYSFRLGQIFFPFAAIGLCCLRAYNFKYILYTFPMILIMFLSAVCSAHIVSSGFYFLWLIYNIFFILFVIASYIKLRGMKQFLWIFRLSIFTIFGFLCLQFLLLQVFHIDIPFLSHQEHLGIYRPALWFYEPSYLATYLSFGLALSAYISCIQLKKMYWIDVIICFLGILLTTSSTGYLSILLIFACILLFNFFNQSISFKKRCIVTASVLGLGILFFISFYFISPKTFELFFMRIFKNGLIDASGDRMKKYREAIEVFCKYPVLGIGPNNYHFYFNMDASYQPTNISLELLATMGIFGFLAFYFLIFGLIWKQRKNKQAYPFLFAMLVFMICLQANQNYLRLYLWTYLGIVLGCLYVYPVQCKPKKIYINGMFMTQSLTGIQRLCYEFCRRLEGNQFVLLAPKKMEIDVKDISISIRRIGPFKGILWEQLTLPLFMLTRRKSTLWNLGNIGPVFYPGTTMIHDIIFFEPGYRKDSWSFKLRVLTLLNANRYEKIICPSLFTKERLLDKFPAVSSCDIVVANPGYTHIYDFGEKEYTLPAKEYYLCVSSVLPNKNFAYIISLARLRSQDSFVVIGKKDKVSDLFQDIPENVIFTGYVLDEELKYLYAHCKGFISPSLYEGFGVPPLEAMGFGCEKIYIADIEVYHEVYGASAIYFDPKNILDLHQKLDAENNIDKEEREKVLEKYTWENFKTSFLEQVME